MSGSYSKSLKYVISLSIALVLMWFSFKGVKWDDFIAGLRSCRWEYILLSMAASIVAFYLRGLRWRELLLPIDPSIKRMTTFNAVNIGYIANFVFPRIGEFVRCGVITGNSAVVKGSGPDYPQEGNGSMDTRRLASYEKVLGTVVLNMAGVLAILITAALMCGFDWYAFKNIAEEFATGKTLTASIKAGYNRSIALTIDVHVLVFAAALILSFIATGAVFYAATILVIGTLLSAACTLGVTRFFFYVLLALPKRKIAFCNFKREETEDA